MISKLTKKTFNWEVILYCLAAFVLPNIFLFNVYSQNKTLVPIEFSHILFIALGLGVASLLGLFLIKLFTASLQGSILVIAIWWLLFWFFENTFALVPFATRRVFFVLIAIGFSALIVLLRVVVKKTIKLNIVFTALAGVLTLLFLFNATAPIIAGVGNLFRQSVIFVIRNEFEIDDTTPSPDIFWLHVDGMISFEAMEYHFGYSQADARSRLQELGFVIYENAEFAASNTVLSVPALLSPDFYDSYLNELFTAGRELLAHQRAHLIWSTVGRDSVSFGRDIAPYHEFFHAFLQADYQAVMIAELDWAVFAPIDRFYRLGHEANIVAYPFTIRQEQSQNFGANAIDLLELLSVMTPLPAEFVERLRSGGLEWRSIAMHDELVAPLIADRFSTPHEREVHRMLIDSLTIDQPKIVYVATMFAHPSEWYYHGDGTGHALSRFDLYPTAFDYSVTVMIKMIETILAYNPDAVIVIQSDHGLHVEATQTAMLAAGFSETDVINLHNSVLSAVRIPDVYGSLDQPLDPRNIARELINRFVGLNYDLLQ